MSDDKRGHAHDATLTASDPSDASDATEQPTSAFEHYDVESEHARGGIGRVLRAWDNRLQRPVAIKELLTANDQHARRFLREIGITARLQHPSIVPVYEAGKAPNGSPFYAMRFVSGRTLRQLIDDAHSLDERMALLPNVLAVADAVAYASSEGIVHRDLKPSNVIIGSFGETVVIDWGLAKVLGEASDSADLAAHPYRTPVDDRTVAGTVLGTPFYMPPEQAAGEEVDARADVYALGAMLYHVLVGQPPYSGDSAPTPTPTSARSVLDGAPAALVSVQPNVPSDLVALVDKAMARDAAARYPSAKEFADDLRRYQTGQLVGAHEYSRVALIGRWLKRHRTPVAVAALFTAVLVAGGIAGVRQIIAERNSAVAQRQIAQSRSNQLTLTQAASALESDPTATLAWLKSYPLDAADWPEAQRLAAAADARGVARWELHGHKRHINAVIAGPNERQFSSVSNDGTLRIWDLDSGVERAKAETQFFIGWSQYSPDRKWLITFGDGNGRLFRVAGDALDGGRELSQRFVYDVAFAADGRHALLATDQGLVEVDLERAATRPFETSGRASVSLAYRQDGRVVALSQDAALHVWSPDGKAESAWTVPEHRLWRAAFDASGRFAALTATDRTLAVLDTTNGSFHLMPGGNIASQAQFTPDAKAVVAVTALNTLVLWTLDGDTVRPLQTHVANVNAYAISADGNYIASGDRKGEIVVTSSSSGATVTLTAHKEVTSLAFVGADLVAGYEDGSLRIWDAPLHLAGRTLLGHWSNVYQLAFSPDGQWLATGSADKSVRLWPLAGGPAKIFSGHSLLVQGLAFSPSGKWLGSAAADQTVRIWELSSGRAQILQHPDSMRRVRFVDDQHVVTGGDDGVVRLWDLATAQFKELAHHKGAIFPLLLDATREHVYSGAHDGTIHVWNLATGKEQVWQPGLGPINQMELLAHDAGVAMGTETGHVALLNAATGAIRWRGEHKGLVSALSVAPTGKSLASGGEDGAVQVWDAATGAPGLQFRHEATARALSFSSDGRWLASGGYDGVVRIFDLGGGVSCSLGPLDSHVTRLSFSPDSATLALGANDGSVHLWRSAELASCAPRSPPVLRDWIEQHTNLTIAR